MANDETPAGFLSRWSRRKAEVREGRVLDEPPAPTPISTRAVPQPSPQSALADAAPAAAQAGQPAPKPEAPTLADVDQLTPESSYANFMSRDVAPEVKNAAMKKLFSDPHFNVMDRMDIYIDDYGIPDPLPAAMLRQMTSAKFLNLFDDEPELVDTPSLTDSPTHDHADLRLQPDAAPRPEGTEPKPL
ncbi:DUF3306 domain-containing protein [Limnohabitans sp. TS-CS-82]|uniref:DUF3306 domain-containing protein n=1 Tax=Limnohabitans sp. TS-CS-82 TaxID=2094193 RepID=UPI000CF2B43E|nr:DUF3306 domain-containing protein [Limnohabitans sp. TS-CS-82]PQA82010.1 DUF3306 domain-containing protein [Limnohabitans sp. TS-CS-82]